MHDDTTYLRKHIQRAREMRKSPAPAEAILWSKLRNRQLGGFRFRRQQPIGPYIADFYCSEKKLIIEADGDSHVEREEYDLRRDYFMAEHGLKVLRVSNQDIFENLDALLNLILEQLTPPSPGTQGEGRGEGQT